MRRFPRTIQKTLVSSLMLRSAAPLFPFTHAFHSASSTTTTSYATTGSLSHNSPISNHQSGHCSRHRLFSSISDFSPAPPPGTHGTPVFDNVDLTVLQQGENDNSILESTQRNADPNAVFVVTGASRGIGLQFVKSLLERTQGTIVACCRTPTPELTALTETSSSSRVEIVELDLEDQASITSAGQYIRDTYDRVDALFNVAGILHDGTPTSPGPERALAKIDRAWFEKTMAVNLIGPVMWTQEMTPLLSQRRQRSKDKTSARPKAVVVNLSARVGSISDNGLGGWYSYRMSKSALNQFTRTAALELKRSQAWAIAVHPGTTATGLSEPFQKNVKEGSLFPVEFTVQQLLNVVDALEEKHSGGLYDWSGQSLSF